MTQCGRAVAARKSESYSRRAVAAAASRTTAMTFHSLLVQPIIALVAGILILVQPSLLSYIVAIYLIIVGVIGLIPQFS
jgi:threonine/homoserine efflux transporter RhtA